MNIYIVTYINIIYIVTYINIIYIVTYKHLNFTDILRLD